MPEGRLGNGLANGEHTHITGRASELDRLVRLAIDRLVSFVQTADREVGAHQSQQPLSESCLVDSRHYGELLGLTRKSISTSSEAGGEDSFIRTLDTLLRYSVNTSAPGFLDKLYSAPLAPGIAAELILAVLNTNVHVYHVSPVLTLVEKYVTKELAKLFGLTGPRAGGISVQGGSASNTTSIVIARNTLFPRTIEYGNSVDGLDLVLFTSQHGHYSIEKAAQQCGFGTFAVISVPVDPVTGAMIPAAFASLVQQAKADGRTPFYVNATAGTTVLGSFDPFVEISAIAKQNNMWMHIDGAWGGSFAFSDSLSDTRLQGCHLADSIAINPHKMMGVPLTCSFLLAQDLKQFHDANTLKAGYLFHDNEDDSAVVVNGTANGSDMTAWQEPKDLADMTLQCGRRGDALKLFMSWQYYGTNGYKQKIENAYDLACHMVNLMAERPNFVLVSTTPPPCLQVCFYYAPGGRLLYGDEEGQITPPTEAESSWVETLGKYNSKITENITRALVAQGFMVDFAPALEGQEARGSFFRVVINISTPRETVERLLREIEIQGQQVHDAALSQHSQ